MPGYNSTVENTALTTTNVVLLTGGVGGAKLADGFAQILPPDRLTIIVNTGDDFRHMGLWVCPDVDTFDPILNVYPVRAMVADIPELVFAVTPIIGGEAVKGPAAKMMAERGLPVTAQGVAAYYGDLIDVFVYDSVDAGVVTGREQRTTNTLMHTQQDRANLARTIMDYTMELLHT
jgi:2-phospho-L-lactate transferase/gluconeogenesis factor (CofD/UPF0052 family)